MTLNLRSSILLCLLFSFLYISIHQAIQQAPPIPFSSQKISDLQDSSLSFSELNDLERVLKEILEKSRTGKSISIQLENNLRRVRDALLIYTGVNHKLIAKLIAMINEILELNAELIHLPDGKHQTDDS